MPRLNQWDVAAKRPWVPGICKGLGRRIMLVYEGRMETNAIIIGICIIC
jgi:hypothetical protein